MIKVNKTILYIGGFELPDKNAAAQRVISNGKILRDLGFNVVYIGNCFFEGRNILIYDEEEIGEVFLNYNNLQHDSAESFDNKSCNEEIYLNVATYKIEGDTLILLEKRFIPNIKTR
ncbi:MAG: hypothetical protein M0O93_06000 [Bacteroidales bacterium]|nr:hypothetical protein [Bacteroidales bacterium]